MTPIKDVNKGPEETTASKNFNWEEELHSEINKISEKVNSGLKNTAKKSQSNNNQTGVFVGAASSVLLEILSPTGSFGSAVFAGIASGVTASALNTVIGEMPESREINIGAGVATFFAGSTVGRFYASYFPGNL